MERTCHVVGTLIRSLSAEESGIDLRQARSEGQIFSGRAKAVTRQCQSVVLAKVSKTASETTELFGNRITVFLFPIQCNLMLICGLHYHAPAHISSIFGELFSQVC